MPSWKRHLGTFSMNYSNTIDYDSLTLKDYVDELPRSNETKPHTKTIIKADGTTTVSNRVLTNCVAPGHADTHPSMILYEGNKRIVHHCYSCGNRDAINNYFHERFTKRFLIKDAFDEQRALDKINKEEASYE